MTLQEVIAIALFAITIGGLIWNMAKLYANCDANKQSLVRAHDRIDKLEDTQNNKIKELSEQLKSVTETQIRMEEKLNILLKK
jgi:type II secretory pathway component PulC